MDNTDAQSEGRHPPVQQTFAKEILRNHCGPKHPWDVLSLYILQNNWKEFINASVSSALVCATSSSPRALHCGLWIRIATKPKELGLNQEQASKFVLSRSGVNSPATCVGIEPHHHDTTPTSMWICRRNASNGKTTDTLKWVQLAKPTRSTHTKTEALWCAPKVPGLVGQPTLAAGSCAVRKI